MLLNSPQFQVALLLKHVRLGNVWFRSLYLWFLTVESAALFHHNLMLAYCYLLSSCMLMPDSCSLGGQCWSFLSNFGVTLLLGHGLCSIWFRSLYLWFFTVQSPAIYSVAVAPAATSVTKLERSGDSSKNAGQSEQTGFFGRGALRDRPPNRAPHTGGEYRCSSHGQYEKVKLFFDMS